MWPTSQIKTNSKRQKLHGIFEGGEGIKLQWQDGNDT